MAACSWPAPAPCAVRLGQTVSKHGPSCRNLSIVQPFGLAMWVSIASDAVCATALQQAVVDFGVVDTDALQAVLNIPETAAGFARALCTALRAARPAAEIGTMTNTAVLKDTAVQTALADDVVDSKTAEAMIAEALSMLDEANERERAADERARSWEGRAELGTTLLRAAEDRTDRAQAERQAAERLADTERVARLVAEQLLAAEAALADAAVEQAQHEYRARCPLEADLALWKALAGGRAGRGGRGRSPPNQSPPPPPPPPPAELIQLVLAVPIEREGDMSEAEALAILNVTHKSPKWLILQVHPDRHPDHQAEAKAATSRVNQARDVRCRHVTDWTQ